MNADGTHQVQLTRDAGSSYPAWSPDGKRIAFINTGRLEAMNADSSSRHAVFEDPAQPLWSVDWSPDGSRFVVSSVNGEIVVMRTDGTQQRVIASDGNFAAWSPAGNRIAYQDDNVAIINADGTGKYNVGPGGDAFMPEWSPDATWLVYSNEHPASAPVGDFRGEYIDIVRPDGSGRTTIADSAAAGTLAWSPDGTRLAFDRPEYDPDTGTTRVFVYTMNVDGTDQQWLGEGTNPDWQPLHVAGGSPPLADSDADGYTTLVDCNDSNAAIHPGAFDTPGDGIDQDCNGTDAQSSGTPPTSAPPVNALTPSVTIVVGSAQAPQAPPLSSEGPPEAALVIASKSLRALRHGRLKVKAVCSETCRIDLRLLMRGNRVIAHGATLARAGKIVTIRLGLTRMGKRTLRRAHSARLVLRGTVTDVAGNRRALRRIRLQFSEKR